MKKMSSSHRTISFFSEKNHKMESVTDRFAKEYADILEQRRDVERYEIDVRLEKSKYENINPVDVRKEYFQTEWYSDFLIHYIDGSIGIRELVVRGKFMKRAVIEQLELSRRYWTSMNIRDWKLVVCEKRDNDVF